MTASSRRIVRNTPATDAAGPESNVRAGSRRRPVASIAPPSPRITMTGATTPAARTPSSTCCAVCNAIGRMDALSAAVTVRNSSPYRPVISADPHDGRPREMARATALRSALPSSGANASATQIERAPPATSRSSAASIAASSNPSVTSTSSATTGNGLPGASSRPSSRVRLAARRRSGRRPSANTPTMPTSPSNMALTACVVECVTSWTRSGPTCAATSAVTRTTPAAGPPTSVCVVGNADRAMTLPSVRSNAIALVNVPPTSTPIRIWDGEPGSAIGSGTGEFEAAAPARGDDERVHATDDIDHGQDHLSQHAGKRRVVAGGLGEEDRQVGPARQEVHVDDGRLLQGAHRVADQRHRRRHDDDDRDRKEGPDRQHTTELQHRPRNTCENNSGSQDAEHDPCVQAGAERQHRLVEQHRLEA